MCLRNVKTVGVLAKLIHLMVPDLKDSLCRLDSDGLWGSLSSVDSAMRVRGNLRDRIFHLFCFAEQAASLSLWETDLAFGNIFLNLRELPSVT